MTVALLIPTYFRWKHTYSHRFQIPGLPIPDSKFQVCQWSSWSYGPCSVSCGQGLQPATRQKLTKLTHLNFSQMAFHSFFIVFHGQLFSDGCNTVEDLVWVQQLQPGSATTIRAPLLVGRLLMFCQKWNYLPETCESPVSREFSKILLTFHFSISISRHFHFTFHSRSRS